MFASKFTTSVHSTGSPFAPNPFGVPSNLGSSFTMASGTTSGTNSPFPVPPFGGSVSASAFSSTPARGFSSSGPSAFGQKPAFGTSTTAGFGFSSAPTVGQWTSVFGRSDVLGATKSSSSTQTSFSGSQVSAQPFGSHTKGSRVATYARTAGVDAAANIENQVPINLVSISAMPINKDKSHEELRCEDYQSGDKGGFVSGNFNPNPNAFSSVSASVSPFSSSTCNVFAIPNVGSCATCPPFTSSYNALASTNPFPFTSPSITSSTLCGFSSSSFANSITNSSCSPSTSVTLPSSPFGPTSSSSLIQPTNPFPFTSPSITSSTFCGFSSSSFTNSITNSSCSPSTSVTLPSSPFGPTSSSLLIQPTNPFPFTSPSITSSTFCGFSSSSFTNSITNSSCSPSTSVTLPSSPFGPTSSSSLIQPSIFPASSVNPVFCPSPVITFPLQKPPIFNESSLANFLPKTSIYAPTISAPSVFSSPSITNSSFPVSSSVTLPASSFSPTSSSSPIQPSSLSALPEHHVPFPTSAKDIAAQRTGSQTTAAGQQLSGVNPFGSLPPIPKMSIDGPHSSPTVHYGISSLPVQEKPATVRISSLVTVRHISRRNRLPVQKYDPKTTGPKVPFFMDDREIPVSEFVPRENPRALVIRPSQHWPLRTNSEKLSGLEHKLSSTHIYDNNENRSCNVETYSEKPKMEHADDSTKEWNSLVKVHDVEKLLPKPQLSGYYTEPQIQELAAKERAEPRFCSHVKNFVVGRHGYGNIKFMGETDVRSLDLESIFEFNNREVIVYKDESKKPPVGEGLNKPAEVTLLNIKCFDKKTGDQYMDGPRVEKFRDMLKKKGEEQGAEFVSYDPVGGEWKFRVQHF